MIFDLDGTLTDVQSIWQHMHEAFGTSDIGKVNAEKFRRGEIDYKDWARLDAMCWKGRPFDDLLHLCNGISYTKGSVETVEMLRAHGIRTAVVSAGLSFLAEKAKDDLRLDMAVSNELVVKDRCLTGEVRVRVGIDNKEEAMNEVAWMLGSGLSEAAGVGDNDFDLPKNLALRIAFNPTSDDTKAAADITVESDDLRDVLDHILSFKKD